MDMHRPAWPYPIDWVNLQFLGISKQIQKFNFITHLVHETMQFTEFCNLIDIEFWPITQEPDISQICGFQRKVEDQWYFHVQEKNVHMNESYICQNPQNFIFWVILGLFGSSWPIRVFFKHQATSLFLLYNTSTLWKKSGKIDEPFLRSWQKVKQSQIHRTLLPSLNAPLNPPGLVIMPKNNLLDT